MQVIVDACNALGVEVAKSNVWAKGGAGGTDLAEKVIKKLNEEAITENKYLYDVNDSIEDKIQAVCEYYGGKGVIYSDQAKEDIKDIVALGKDNLPICVARHSIQYQII